MADECDDYADQGHIPLAKTLEETRAEEYGAHDCRDDLAEKQDAEQRIIMEDVLAVVRQDRACHHLDDALHHPDRHGHPEILVAEQAFQGFDDRNLADLLARFDDDSLFALREAEHQENEGEHSLDAHDLDPGSLVVAKHLDERQGCRDGDDLADWREGHSRDREHVALT